MITPQWIGITLFLGALMIPGCGAADPSQDPAAAPAIQARTAQIERYKAQAAKPGRLVRPAR